MRNIVVSVSLGLVGCRKTTTLEVEDDCSDQEIEDMAREEMYGMIEWGYHEYE